jgi:tRNA threonylcarbamoyladenosine biosynthesis protein TsaE
MSNKIPFTHTQLHTGVRYVMDNIPALVQFLHDYLAPYRVVTLTGPLGAGKTTLVSHLLRSYGITQEITSPTFTYVNVYNNEAGKTFYHFDLYRIGSLDEFLQAGFDEYLYQPQSLAIIEWPEVIMPLLTHDVCHVKLDYDADLDARMVKVKG